MTTTDLKTQRAVLRAEFDRNWWRKQRLDKKLEGLAGEIERLTIEIAAAEIRRDANEIPEIKLLAMAVE